MAILSHFGPPGALPAITTSIEAYKAYVIHHNMAISHAMSAGYRPEGYTMGLWIGDP